jgi:hypothetical protein
VNTPSRRWALITARWNREAIIEKDRKALEGGREAIPVPLSTATYLAGSERVCALPLSTSGRITPRTLCLLTVFAPAENETLVRAVRFGRAHLYT